MTFWWLIFYVCSECPDIGTKKHRGWLYALIACAIIDICK